MSALTRRSHWVWKKYLNDPVFSKTKLFNPEICWAKVVESLPEEIVSKDPKVLKEKYELPDDAIAQLDQNLMKEDFAFFLGEVKADLDQEMEQLKEKKEAHVDKIKKWWDKANSKPDFQALFGNSVDVGTLSDNWDEKNKAFQQKYSNLKENLEKVQSGTFELTEEALEQYRASFGKEGKRILKSLLVLTFLRT